jgi:hypothetical protein
MRHGNLVWPEEKEKDLPPEYCRYRDEGCRFAASCLRCPFERCLQEEKGGGRRYLRRKRDGEMVRLFREGRTVKELAIQFAVSPRTVQRAVKGEAQDQKGTAAAQ